MNERILCLDVGDVRIGVAVSDALRMIATPVEVIRRVGFGPDVKRVQELCRQYDTTLVLSGLPLNMDGSEGFQAEKVKLFGNQLEKAGLTVYYQDERLTTVTAEHALLEDNMHRAQRKQHVDKVAAAVILQQWLDLVAFADDEIDTPVEIVTRDFGQFGLVVDDFRHDRNPAVTLHQFEVVERPEKTGLGAHPRDVAGLQLVFLPVRLDRQVTQQEFLVILRLAQKEVGAADGLVEMAPAILRIGCRGPDPFVELVDRGVLVGVVRLVAGCGEHGAADPVEAEMIEHEGVHSGSGLEHAFVVDEYLFLVVIGRDFAVEEIASRRQDEREQAERYFFKCFHTVIFFDNR